MREKIFSDSPFHFCTTPLTELEDDWLPHAVAFGQVWVADSAATVSNRAVYILH